MPSDPLFPDITVNLTGTDGRSFGTVNPFAVIVAVSKAMQDEGVHAEDVDRFTDEATGATHDEAVEIARRWVNVT